MSYPIAGNEDSRLHALRALGIVRSGAPAAFGSVVATAAHVFDCAAALISLEGADARWIEAGEGMAIDQPLRDAVAAIHAEAGNGVLVVPYAREDPRLAGLPAVAGAPHIRFYAGCPITIDGGRRPGILCVAGGTPGTPTDGQLAQLRNLANVVEQLVVAHKAATAANAAMHAADETADMLQVVFDHFPGGVCVYDRDDRLVRCNARFRDLLDLDEDFTASRPTLESYIRLNVERGDYGAGPVEDIVEAKLTQAACREPHEYIRSRPDGRVLEVKFSPIPSGGFVSTYSDVTDRKAVTQKLRDSEARARKTTEELETTLANMTQGVSVYDSGGRLVMWNDNYRSIFAKPAGELYKGITLVEILEAQKKRGDFADDPAAYVDQLSSRLAAGETVKAQITLTNGTVVQSNNAPMPGGGWVGTHSDITEHVTASKRILEAAHHDSLTGLANRTKYNLELAAAIESAGAGDAGHALMLVDLDRFKNVNDTFGHGAGDRLLVQVAERLTASVRSTDCVETGRQSDLVARLGGDEFAILFHQPQQTVSFAKMVAARIVEQLSTPFEIDGNTVEIGASVGIVLISQHNCDVETVQSEADYALYKVKENGRNDYRIFDETLRKEIGRQREIRSSLAVAVSQGAFELRYQPIVALDGKRLYGWEALLRWPRPDHYPVPPSEFIQVAETTGHIREIGTWVLNTGLREAVKWNDDAVLCVNVSARQLGDGAFVEDVHAALERWKVPASRLEFDLQESAILQNDHAMREELERLKATGISLTLDDFGTGSSSLGLLRNFRFDRIKIDRSFISKSESDGQSATLVASICHLARGLEIETVAEGIETEAQYTLARIAGCTYGQGFFLGHPRAAPLDGNPVLEGETGWPEMSVEA